MRRVFLFLLVSTTIFSAYGSDKPASYDKGTSFQKFLSWTDEKRRTTQEILKTVAEKKESLLDIGAGNGMLTKLLEPHFAHITAIEPSTSLFDELAQNLNSPKHALINSTLEQVSLEQALRNQQFDVILASHIFQYITKPLEAIRHIDTLLKKSGVFLLINNKNDCDFWKFHGTYRKEILGPDSPDPSELNYDLQSYLEQVFEVEKVSFDSTISIPSVDDAISIFDLLYDIEFDKISEKAITKVRNDLQSTYANNPLVFTFENDMYVCRKK